MKLTDMTLQKLAAPERGQKFYTDESLSGFGVRVSQGGSKTFLVIVGRERRQQTLGRYPIVTLAQARERARTILAERQLGIVRRPTPVFATVHDEYLAQRDDRLRPSTRQADDYYFKHFQPLWKKKLADITTEDVEEIIDGIEAPSTRRHTFLRLKGMYRYAMKRRYVEHSPLDPLDCPADMEPRERVLSDDELRQVIHTARAYGYPFGTIIELLAITGQRRQQIGSLSTEHVDFENRIITWPANLMKTGRRHSIPLSPMTEAILRTLTPNKAGLYFPSRVNTGFVGWSYHKRRFDQDCGVKNFRIHDLRRTLATRWQELGIEIATTEKMLSHSAVTGGLVGVYQRSTYLEKMRAAIRTWEEWLQTLLSTTESTTDGTNLSGLHRVRA